MSDSLKAFMTAQRSRIKQTLETTAQRIQRRQVAETGKETIEVRGNCSGPSRSIGTRRSGVCEDDIEHWFGHVQTHTHLINHD